MNNVEIERKFLVKTLPEGLDKYQCKKIRQAYISTDPTIRLRQQDDEYILTVKGRGLIERKEFELPLNAQQFEKLWKKTEGGYISKKRYIIPFKADENLKQRELKIELDVYEDNLSGFMNAEVEFSSLNDALLFVPPEWFGAEVTEDRRYSNASLVKYGIPVKK